MKFILSLVCLVVPFLMVAHLLRYNDFLSVNRTLYLQRDLVVSVSDTTISSPNTTSPIADISATIEDYYDDDTSITTEHKDDKVKVAVDDDQLYESNTTSMNKTIQLDANLNRSIVFVHILVDQHL